MDNIQKLSIYIDIPSSQTFRSLFYWLTRTLSSDHNVNYRDYLSLLSYERNPDAVCKKIHTHKKLSGWPLSSQRYLRVVAAFLLRCISYLFHVSYAYCTASNGEWHSYGWWCGKYMIGHGRDWGIPCKTSGMARMKPRFEPGDLWMRNRITKPTRGCTGVL
jgi:hypothetical protein